MSSFWKVSIVEFLHSKINAAQPSGSICTCSVGYCDCKISWGVNNPTLIFARLVLVGIVCSSGGYCSGTDAAIGSDTGYCGNIDVESSGIGCCGVDSGGGCGVDSGGGSGGVDSGGCWVDSSGGGGGGGVDIGNVLLNDLS